MTYKPQRTAAQPPSEQLKHRQSAIRGLVLQATNAIKLVHLLADAAFLLPGFEGSIALFSAEGTILAASDGRENWHGIALPSNGPTTFRATQRRNRPAYASRSSLRRSA